MPSSSLPGTTVRWAGWRKSSLSMANGNCVEAASNGTAIAIRDSTDPAAPMVAYEARAWRAFVTAVKAGTGDSA
jgi:Domain of unknown function (DUF397)